MSLRLHAGPLDVLDTQTAVFIGLVYAYLPIAIVPIYIVLIRIPRDAARSEPRSRRVAAGRPSGTSPCR